MYTERTDGALALRWVKAPTSSELTDLAQRIGRLLERDAENTYLAGEAEDADPMESLLGSSITCRIAVGPRTETKVLTLQTPPACDEADRSAEASGKAGGFSLHAGVAARADERGKLERLVPLHQPPGGLGDAPVAHTRRYRLHGADALHAASASR